MNKRLSLLLAVLCCFAPHVAAAQRATLDSFDHPAKRQIAQLLAQERHMAFDNATLADVAVFLEQAGIPTYVDQQALKDIGLAADTRVSMRRRRARLDDGLTLLLRPLDLTWTLQNGQLVITTPEEAEDQLITKVYDVRHLVDLVPISWGTPWAPSAETVYAYDFDSLIELIISSLAPDSWTDTGGTGSIEPFHTRRLRVLVISQTYDVHRRIGRLLRVLGERGGVRPLPAPSPGSTADDIPRARSGWIDRRTRGGIHSSRLRTTGQPTRWRDHGKPLMNTDRR